MPIKPQLYIKRKASGDPQTDAIDLIYCLHNLAGTENGFWSDKFNVNQRGKLIPNKSLLRKAIDQFKTDKIDESDMFVRNISLCCYGLKTNQSKRGSLSSYLAMYQVLYSDEINTLTNLGKMVVLHPLPTTAESEFKGMIGTLQPSMQYYIYKDIFHDLMGINEILFLSPVSYEYVLLDLDRIFNIDNNLS